VVAGLVVGVVLARRSVPAGPAARGAAIVDALVDSIGRGARHVAAVVQHGSLPLYLATTVVVLAAASAPFVLDIDTSSLYWANNWVEGVVVVMIVAAALASTVVRSRLGAAMVLGAVGFSVAGLFVNLGAPDLVLTQLLVETVVVVGFVVGLGRLATKFPRATRLWLSAITVGLAAGAARPSGEPPVLDLADAAVEDGGGNNVVNVILTDTRGLDTVGEAIVLMVVAVGILTVTTRRPARRTEFDA
jgi:multicomponent Na+:H+ antiporter subunit A